MTAESPVRVRGGRADHAVIAGDLHGRIALRGGGAARQFGGVHLRFGGLQIRAIGIRADQRLVERDAGERRIWQHVAQRELLSGRQSDQAAQRDLQLREIVRDGIQPLLLDLHFDLRAGHVDARRDAGAEPVHRLLMRGLRRGHLRPGGLDAGRGGSDLQVAAGDREHDEVARVLRRQLRRADVFLGAAVVADPCEVEHGLGGAGAQVEIMKGSDNLRNAGKAGESEGREIDLLVGDEQVARDIRQ